MLKKKYHFLTLPSAATAVCLSGEEIIEDAQNHPTVLKGLGIRKLLGKGNEKEAIPKAEDAIHTLPYPQHKNKAIACPGTVRSKTTTFWNEVNLK